MIPEKFLKLLKELAEVFQKHPRTYGMPLNHILIPDHPNLLITSDKARGPWYIEDSDVDSDYWSRTYLHEERLGELNIDWDKVETQLMEDIRKFIKKQEKEELDLLSQLNYNKLAKDALSQLLPKDSK